MTQLCYINLQKGQSWAKDAHNPLISQSQVFFAMKQTTLIFHFFGQNLFQCQGHTVKENDLVIPMTNPPLLRSVRWILISVMTGRMEPPDLVRDTQGQHKKTKSSGKQLYNWSAVFQCGGIVPLQRHQIRWLSKHECLNLIKEYVDAFVLGTQKVPEIQNIIKSKSYLLFLAFFFHARDYIWCNLVNPTSFSANLQQIVTEKPLADYIGMPQQAVAALYAGQTLLLPNAKVGCEGSPHPSKHYVCPPVGCLKL